MHFHVVVPEGVFVVDAAGNLTFVLQPIPTSAEVLAILDRILRQIVRRLAREAADSVDDEPAPELLAQLQAEAATTWRSPTDGKPTVRGTERLRAWCEGFTLHAGVVIAAHDRDALERLCRYGARPAFAHDRLAWTADGKIAYQLKRAWPDGRTHLVLGPVAFLRRLCGIIPPPRRHLVRYAGVFGPASKDRAKLRALLPGDDADADPLDDSSPDAPGCRGRRRSSRLPWADLLRRVFATDVLECPCGGRRTVLAVITDPVIARTVLVALGQPVDWATFAPARAPPQIDFDFADAS